MSTSHHLVLGLFDNASTAVGAARALRTQGVPRHRVSIVAQTHQIEGELAQASGASPGSEIQDSAAASRAGELGGYMIAAVATVLPGIGPIVAAGPLAADLGEAAGHLAGGVGKALEHAGLGGERAQHWEARIAGGAVLIGVHVDESGVTPATDTLSGEGAAEVARVAWPGRLT